MHELDEVDAVKISAREPEPATQLAGEETLAAARVAIGGLRDSDKEVFLLRTSGGLTFVAIAEAPDMPVGPALRVTARRRQRRKLRRFLVYFGVPTRRATTHLL